MDITPDCQTRLRESLHPHEMNDIFAGDPLGPSIHLESEAIYTSSLHQRQNLCLLPERKECDIVVFLFNKAFSLQFPNESDRAICCPWREKK